MKSDQHLLHQFSMDVGQAHIESLKADGELGVIKAKLVLQRGMEIMHMHRIFSDVEAKFIALSQGEAGF